MRPEEKTACARALNDNPLFHLLMDEMDATAVEGCVYADPTDQEKRAAMAAEVRAIRELRQKIMALVEDPSQQNTDAPA